MKKFLLMMAAIVAVSLVSCNENAKYKEQGEAFAKQLNELCQQQDSAAVIELVKTIDALEEEIAATGDTTALAGFREALKDARMRNYPYITTIKVENGETKDAALNDAMNDVLEGKMGIDAVTASIDTLMTQEKKEKKNK